MLLNVHIWLLAGISRVDDVQPRQLLSYLARHSLVDVASALNYPLKISEISTRYTNFEVLADEEQRFFIKRAPARTVGFALAREAAAYRALHGEGVPTDLRRYLPKLFSYDEDAQLLVLELVGSGLDLEHFIALRDEFPSGCAADLGQFLGMLHGNDVLAARARANLPAQVPWVFSVVFPDVATFARFSSASRELVAMLQGNPRICAGLATAAGQWNATSFIHFDVKWGNCLVDDANVDAVGDDDADASARIRVVDWEFAGFGDPRWDVGSVLYSFIRTWISSIPMTGSGAPERYMDFARVPFEVFEPQAVKFLQIYRQGVRRPAEIDHAFLVTVMRFAGARLVQGAYESARTLNQITGETISLVQAAEHCLADPEYALATTLPTLEW